MVDTMGPINNKSGLPPIIPYDSSKESWEEYSDRIYHIFYGDFYVNHVTLKGKPVYIQMNPQYNGKASSYYHITCKEEHELGDRYPNLRRCERIHWIRILIEHLSCSDSKCPICSEIKIWIDGSKDSKGRKRDRIHILHVHERYIVVIEDQDKIYKLITAFYYDNENALQTVLKSYDRHKGSFTK